MLRTPRLLATIARCLPSWPVTSPVLMLTSRNGVSIALPFMMRDSIPLIELWLHPGGMVHRERNLVGLMWTSRLACGLYDTDLQTIFLFGINTHRACLRLRILLLPVPRCLLGLPRLLVPRGLASGLPSLALHPGCVLLLLSVLLVSGLVDP